MSGSVSRVESGEPLQNGSASLTDLLKAAKLDDTYVLSDNQVALDQVVDALAEHRNLKQSEKQGTAPDEYDFSLKSDFKGPEGYQWSPNPEFATAISEWAKKYGLGQDAISDLTHLYAGHDAVKYNENIANNKKRADAHAAEMAKLEDAPARIDAIKKALDAQHGAGAGDEFFRGNTARGIEMLEDMLAKAITGEGRSSPTRPDTRPGKPDLSGLSGRELLRHSYQGGRA